MRTGKVSKKVGQREQLILALLQQPSLEKAAASIGISTVTAWRISKTKEFKEEYRNARWEASSQSLARLQQASGAAVSALLKVMIDKTTPAASRVRAADRVLDHASRATALEDIEARITELERAANPSARAPKANDLSGHTRGNVVLREDQELARRRLQQKGDLFNQGGMWKLRWHEDKIGPDGERMRGWSRAVHIGPSAGAGKLTEKEARRLSWENFLSKLDAGVCAPHSAVTIENFVEQQFLPDHVALLKRSGRSHYESMLKHVLPALRNLRLKDATASDIQKLASSMLGQSYSVQTVKHVRTTVSAIFTHAKRLGWHTGDNPAKLVRLPEMVRRESHALSFDQSFSALASLQSPAREMVLFAILTSMNIAEICGLQWNRVNRAMRSG